MKKLSALAKVQIATYSLLALLMLSLLGYLAVRENIHWWAPAGMSSLIRLEKYEVTEVADPDAPLGTATHYRFHLDPEQNRDLTLAFYLSHHAVEAYIDGKIVYNLSVSDEIPMIKTTGSIWHQIPLPHSDAARELLIVAKPVYEDYDRTPEFFLGRSIDIYRLQVRHAFLDLALSFINVLVGLSFLLYGLYTFFAKKVHTNSNLVAMGLLALSAGLWRLSDTMYSPFMLQSKPIFLYYLSLNALSLVSISTLQSSRKATSGLRWYRVRSLICIGISLILSLELILQWAGMVELRSFLTLTHVMLLLSALLIVVERIVQLILDRRAGIPRSRGNSVWLLALGVLLDLIWFLIDGNSAGKVCTLSSTLLYVVLESSRIQRQRLLENQRLALELQQLSFADSLTGLYNRDKCMQDLRDLENDLPSTLGMILLDVNGLSKINETHGLQYGDQVLQRIAQLIQRQFSDRLYRLGADEFLVICLDLSMEDFQRTVLHMRAALDTEQICDVSIGVSWADGSTIDINELRIQAQEMCVAEKQSYYHQTLRNGSPAPRTGFTGEVLREIEAGLFTVYYQPQVDLASGRVVGAEALVRKFAEDGSLIAPGKFVPFYEVSGVISHVDLFVLRRSCEALRCWKAEGFDLRISVNFSRTTLLEPNIVDVISTICTQEGVPPSSINIEVTESISKMNHDQLQMLIFALKERGFSISLDDFGSQYSNLSILAAMDFDEIKFDRSLIATLEKNKKSRLVVANSLQLCREMEGTTTLAEGIETKGQLDLLVSYQCSYGQGYYFSRPLPRQQFESYLQQHSC